MLQRSPFLGLFSMIEFLVFLVSNQVIFLTTKLFKPIYPHHEFTVD